MDDEGTVEGLSADRSAEIRVRKSRGRGKVTVEKSAAEGLPEGWVKELVITKKKGQRIRRDPYFIDPKTGYIFQSFKDASRYVTTGLLGKHARKPKENEKDEDDSGTLKSLSHAGSVEKKSAENLLEKEKNLNIYVENSKQKSLSSLDEDSGNCELSLKPSTTSSQVPEVEPGKKEEAKDPMERKHVSCSESGIATSSGEHTVEKRFTRSQAKVKTNDTNRKLKRKSLSSLNENFVNCMVSSKPSSVSLQVPDSKEEECGMKEEAQYPTERNHRSSSGIDISATQKDKMVEKRVTRSQATVKKNEDNRRLKRKGEPNSSLTRRVSKRLAGIEAEETPELKTRTSAPQEPAVEPSDEAAAKMPEENPPHDKRTEMPLGLVVADKYEEHSSSETNAALKNGKKTEMTMVSEENNEAAGINSEGHSGIKPNAAKKKEMRLMSCRTVRTTAVVKSDEAADAKFEGASSPEHVASLGSYKQMEKSPPVVLAFQNVVAMSDETVCRKSGGSSILKPNTVLNSHLCVDNNAVQMRNGVKKEIAPILSTGNLAVVKGEDLFLTEKKANKVYEAPSLDSTLADLWKDPCIAFAIKTLTGESLDPPNTAEISIAPRKVTGGGNIHDEEREVSVMPEKLKDGNNGNENNESSAALHIWSDPCIDFAVKTLTGAIPAGFDADQPKSQQSTSSVRTTQVSATKQSDCDYLCQQFNSAHKAVPGGGYLLQQIGTSETRRVSRSFPKG